MSYFRVLVVGAVLCFSTNVLGEDAPDGETTEGSGGAFATMSLADLLNVEISSASKLKQTMREAPSIVSVVTQEQIGQFGWRSINDILYHQPGFFPGQDYDRRTVGARGMPEGWNNNHLLLLVDGIPFNDNLYGTAYTSEITPLVFSKKIEVIRGPGSALYGTNATNGVLTLNTFEARDLKNHSLFRSRIGNRNGQSYDVLAGAEFEHFDAVLAYNHQGTAGVDYESYDGTATWYFTYKDLYDAEYIAPSEFLDDSGTLYRAKPRDARSSSYFFSKLSGKGDLDGLSIQYHHQMWDFQTGHGWFWTIPDFDESMAEQRDILAIKYTHQSETWNQEYVLRFQRHQIDWNMRYAVNDSWYDFYPAGMTEYLRTHADDIFARAQFTWFGPDEMTLLVGLESTVFLYGGDEEHYSNIDLADASYPPVTESNQPHAAGPWFEPVKDKPVTTVGVYGQLTSGALLGDSVTASVGARYDNQFFNYMSSTDEGTREQDKSFQQLSPRLALVISATDDMAIKLLGGRAFRAPSPTEMFGANTWTLASNLEALEPEVITTAELAVDYSVSEHVQLRANGYWTKFENQIAYSLANTNLSTNIYTLTSAGAELELLFGWKHVSGFVNTSFTARLDEDIFEAEKAFVSASPDELTWAPALTANGGLTYQSSGFTVGLVGHFQGEVKRREKDVFSEEELAVMGLTDQPRAQSVPAWLSLDAKVSYQLIDALELGVSATNLLGGENLLVKNLKFPFDYQSEGRRVFAELVLHF